MIECLPSKLKVLSLNPSTVKNYKNDRNEWKNFFRILFSVMGRKVKIVKVN
jgi:hypothetical protein